MTQKYFIITAGPTGAGKTSLIHETLKQLGFDPESTPFTKFLIDDLVENDPMYKFKVREIIDQIDSECTTQGPTCEEDMYTQPSEKLIKEFNDAYFNSRKKGCEEFKAEGEGCDNVLNARLRNIKVARQPIIIFEFVGTYVPTWLLTDAIIPDDYMVITSFALVNVPTLVRRNTSRAFSSVRAFKASGTSPAPRLPNVSAAHFEKVINDIVKTIHGLFQCVNDPAARTVMDRCGQKPVDVLLLFENNGRSHNLLYNSHLQTSVTEADLEQMMQQSLRPAGGRRSRRRRTKRSTRRRRFFV